MVKAKVAILCGQPRLRTILRLSLLADNHEVAEWDHRAAPDETSVAAVVVDLDSLGHEVPDVLDLLGAWGVDASTSLLFISVYPLDLRSLQRVGPYDGLQPPFSPVVLIDRVRRLLSLGGREPRTEARNGRPIIGGGAAAAAQWEP